MLLPIATSCLPMTIQWSHLCSIPYVATRPMHSRIMCRASPREHGQTVCRPREGESVTVTMLVQCLEPLYLLIILLMAAQAIFNIRLRLFIWEIPEHAWLNHAPTIYRDPCLSFTIMLPARHEEDVYQETLQKVYDLNYPRELMQIIAICSDDDVGTIAEAQKKIHQLADSNVQLLIYTDKPTS